MPTRIVLTAEHSLYLDAFHALFEKDPELRVVALASTRDDALAAVAREQPEVAVVVCEGEATSALVEALAPVARVVAVGCRSALDASRAFAASARGVVGAAQPLGELSAALRCVAGGASYVPSWPSPAAETARPAPSSNPLDRLSPRERQVFERLIEGDSNSEIGRRLGISAKTVDTHRTHVMRKMGVHSVVQLVRFAARHELLPPTQEPARSALA